MSITKISTIIIASRALTLFVGLFVIFLVLPNLTKIEQGYFFVFTSIAASQVLFELGLSGLIVHYFSREHAKILINKKSKTKINENINSTEVRRYCRKYFMMASVMYCGIIGLGGAIFLELSPQGDEVDWISPWIIITLGTSLNLFNFNYHAYLNGFSEVASSYLIRIKSNILMVGILSIMVMADAGLLSYPISMMVSNLYATLLLKNACKKLDEAYIHSSGGNAQKFKMDHHQIKIALSAASGYFVANSLTPYTLHFYGAEYAGQIGLGLAIFSAISTLSVARTTAEAPKYGHMIENKNMGLLNNMRVKTTWISLALALSLSVVAMGFVYVIDDKFPSMTNRFLGIKDLVILGLFSISSVALACISTVLRAFKEELLMLPSLGAAIILIASQLWFNFDPIICIAILLLYNALFFYPYSVHLLNGKCQ